MKKLNKYITGVLLLASLASCKKTLTDLNTNPDLVSSAAPEFLLAGATQNMGFGSRSQLQQVYDNALIWMQYVVPEGVATDGLQGRYWGSTTVASGGPQVNYSYYNDYYNGIGRDMIRLINIIDNMSAADQEKYKGVKGICKTLNTFHAWRIADIYGALPYTQAFQPEAYPTPIYDYNWELYKTFDTELKEAATLLAASGASQIQLGNQDFFYAGDYTKWLGLANSIRIKIAQRYEKRDPANLTAVLADIAGSFANAIMSSNEGSFAINNTRDWNNNVDDINNILFSYNASFPLTEQLIATNDPRLYFMIRENDLGTNSTQYNNVATNGTVAAKAKLQLPEYKKRYIGKHASPASAGNTQYGMSGQNRYETFAVTNGNQNLGVLSAIQSRLWVKNGGFGGFNALSDRALMHSNETFVDGASIKMKSYFITYPDICFMMAEIAQKGGNGLGKSAEQWYRAGVQASLNLYKTMAVATGVPSAATIDVSSFANNIPFLGLPSIYSQAWINNLITPNEAWATWKRTGYPQFTDVRPGSNGLIGTTSIAYLENLWNGSENFTILRRGSLPSSSNLMLGNQQTAVTSMTAKDASYGTLINETKGRIWWDAQ